MSRDAKAFITQWVSDNVNAEPYAGPGERQRALQLAEQCRADANAEGLSAHDLDEASKDMVGGGDDLVETMANALEGATDAEVQRLVEKDD